MSEILENRQNLYNNLIADGYFRGDDGEVNFSFEDFCEALNDQENARNFFNNMVEDGYFRDDNGELSLSEEDFLTMIGSMRPKQDYYPITENQRGVFIDWEMNSDTTQYNIPDAQRFDGVTAEALRDAVVTVIQAHPYLNTYFAKKEDDVVQVRNDEAPVEVSITMLDKEPDAAFFQQRVRPFNLLEGPLYRAEVYGTPTTAYLFLDIHHTIFDGGSALAFDAQLKKVLAGEQIAEEQYTAYDRALDEYEFWNSDACREAEAYFDEKLAGIDTTVYPRSSKDTGEAVRRMIVCDIPDSGIEAFCRNHEVTESNYFLTMLMQVLHRVTREENVLITTIHHGRTDLRMMETMGMFVKTQPVVGNMTKQQGLRMKVEEAVQAVQQQMLETQRRDIYSFTKLVERFGIRAEIMFVYQGGGVRSAETKESNHISLELNTAKLPISLIVMPVGLSGYRLRLEYDGSLYNEADMQTLSAMIAAVCQSAPQANTLSEVALMTPDEQKQQIDFCKGKDLPIDIHSTFIAKFTELAHRIPDALAVADANSQFTYGELDKHSDALAHYLVDEGICPDDFVCVMLDRQKEIIMCFHAIHKAAAAYAPLDIDYPADRLQYMMEDCQAKVLLTTHAVFEKKCSTDGLSVDEGHIKVIFIDDLALDVVTEPICLAKPENLAYMIYTSGSTGKPKGTMLHQAGLLNCTEVVVDEQNICEEDHVGVFYAFSFDAHIVSIYPALIRGASIHIFPSSIRKDLELTVNFMKEHGITICGFPTAIGSLVVQNYPQLPLRMIAMGGERMDGLFSDKYTIINAYGPTECTCEVTYFKILPGKVYSVIPIGRPTANNWGFVTDMFGQLLPKGCAGELCFAGIQVGRGYWNLPEKTAEVFCDCPFVSEDRWGRKVRMYHTGDMVRYREDGELEFIGRIDNQVKLRGFRIELGEIENRAMAFDGVKQAAVLVKKINGAEHLCLYYTTLKDVDEKALKQHLSESLAEYMVPDAYMLMDVMPMTPNGKINRKILPVPEIKAEEIIAPANETEQQLLDIAIELLKHDQFGVTTNLLSMGLTSLLAMRMSAMIQQRMKLSIPTKDIFSHPTIREMAQLSQISVQSSQFSSLPSLLSSIIWELRDAYPITENQRGIYIDWEMHRDTTQYNMPDAKKVEGVTVEQLRQALFDVVNAHPHLKTHFAMKDGDIVQLRNDDESVQVDVVKMDCEPTEADFEALVQPFDLFKDHLYRFKIIQTPTSLYLFRDFHHIVFDGGSFLIFEGELQNALEGHRLEKETYTAYDRALYERQLIQSELCAEADTWFDNLLGGGDAILYPKSAQPESSQPLAGRVSLNCKRKPIEMFCRNNQVTGSNYFLTAFLQVLHRLTREENIIITTINNGRSSAEMLGITGMFVKTMPVASSYDFEALLKTDYVTLVRQTQEQMNETFARDFYPLTRIVERHAVRPNIMFEYQVGVGLEAELQHAEQDSVGMLNTNTAKIPLTLGIYGQSADNYRIAIEYDASIYNAEDMMIILKAMREMCEQAAISDGNSFATISLVPADEQKILVAQSAGPRMEIDFTKTYMDHFLSRAAQCPDSLAVADDNSEITYAQLNRYSDLIAQKLIALGVKKHDFIGVMIERCKEFPVCVFGIHKAAGAYLPLDIEYPNERLQYMLEDSEARVLITTHAVLEEKRKEGEFNADTIVYLDEIDWEKESATVEPVNRCTPDCYTYIIYTSGSTGKPKGVVLHHKGLLNYIFSTIEELHLTADDRISSHRSFSFDSHIEDLYAILLLGGSLHIMPEEIRKDLQAIRDFVVNHQITGGGYTTSIATMLVNTFDMPVRYLSAIGEKLMGVVSKEAQIINAYGPTECTDHITIHYLEKDKVYKDIPIGHVIANSWCFIVDSAGQLAPMGACGELCIAGIQVGIGYWHLPERTAQSFVDCPFVDHNIDGTPVRMYHTGDLARFNEYGELECLGRIDNQVKLRGYRVELGEIETEAMKVDGIQQAVAMIREINGDKHLVLYYTVDDGKSVSDEQIDAHMKGSKLPAYMVPEVYMFMEAMPRTPNGKINRRGLPVPKMSVGDIVAPATDMEKKLYEIAIKVLKTDNFGVTTNLMSVGMNSLSAMRLSASIQQELDLNIPTKTILQTPTVREISKLSKYNEELETNIAVIHTPRKYYPITENQRGVYIDWEMNRNTTQYNIPYVQKMEGVDANSLRDALIAVVEAHPYLKNRFNILDGDIVQMRDESEPAVVSVTKLATEPTSEFFQEKVKPFDLLADRLYRIEVIQSPKNVYLFVDIHHTIFDGGSQYIFITDLKRVLAGESLETETYTAWDRALDEQEMMRSGKYEDARKYFDELLGEAEIASYPQSANVSETTNKACIFHANMESKGIVDFCRKNQLTENSFFMAVTSLMLQRLTREDELIFTSVTNGRNHVRMQQIMGMFVKTLPVVSVPAKGTFAEVARQMQQQYIMTQEHGCIYPYTQLVTRFPANPEIMFAYQGGVGASQDSADESLSVALDTAKMPLMITVYPKGASSFVLELEYAADRYSEQDMQKLSDVFVTLVRQAYESDQTVNTFHLVSSQEESALTELGYGGKLEFDTSETLVDILRRQTKLTPDHPLVVFKDKVFTYKEADELTDRLAACLIKKGVKPEQAVGVMIVRSELMFIYSMAIMKAGATYMPLDSHFPEDRLMFMCEDAGVSIILSDIGLVQKTIPSFGGTIIESSIISSLPPCDIDLPEVKPTNRMVILYTSGSTGKPKGVELEQHSIVNFCHWYVHEFEVTAADRAIAYANYGFDAHMIDLYPVMLVGATTYILPEEMRMDLSEINDYIEKNHLTITFMTTQIGCQMATLFENKSLRLLSTGGEKMPPITPPAYRLVNAYGPTECALFSTTYNVKSYFEGEFIGTPLSNYQLYVIDKTMNLVPEGIPGELLICGTAVARGYLNRPELTAEKFITFNGLPAYRSGDLVRWTVDPRDGSKQIEFMGRIDTQVKLRGLRIELGEIENRMASFEGISQSCVIVRELNGTQHLCAYFVANREISTEVLSRYLGESLAEFMVPTAYMQLEKMPLNPNGKINKRELPEPIVQSETECVPPADAKEKILFNLVARMLKHENFGVTDDLFRLGLTSLLAIKVVAQARQFNVVIKLEDMLKMRNIRDLLHHNMNLCYWQNGYDPNKPVVILPSGETIDSHLHYYSEQLSQQYSVFVIEPITAHFDVLFSDSDIHEVIEMYYSLIDIYVPKNAKIEAFTGHCFGGELAYRLAIQHARKTGVRLPVLMLDVFWLKNPELNFRYIMPEDLPEEFLASHQDEMADYVHIVKMHEVLGCEDVPPLYDGDLYLVSSAKMDDGDKAVDDMAKILFPDLSVRPFAAVRFGDNQKYWRQYYPDLKCSKVDAGHVTMLEQKPLVEEYAQILNEMINKKA